MSFAHTSLRDEYAAAVEQMAAQTLGALRGAGGAVALVDPGTANASRPLLAAVRVLGPDLFAPQLLGGAAPDTEAVLLLAEAHRAFPSTAAEADGPDAPEGAALIAAWRDWATGALFARTLRSISTPGLAELSLRAPQPDHAPQPQPHAWQAWSVRMAQLSALALPGLDGPVHRTARTHTLALARGTVRSMLRRDHRVAARLARWLAWSRTEGLSLPLEVEPVLERIHAAGDGSSRTALELGIAEALLAITPNGATA
ncbi:hypothetical protein [Kitasatospora sp. NPDC092286]|uniref:hypothetical protein n=1 Tax=Kitasatospora sp. NPDC092286 TaxID=3364087 RepID=UPI0037FC58B2